MTRRVLVPALVGCVALGALAAAPASAKHKKPITKSYSVTNPVPHPAGGAAPGNGCHEGTEGVNKHTEPFTIPEAGTLVIELTEFQVDWDLVLLTDKGAVITESAGDQGATKEKISWKKGKPGQKVQIVACNWSGGPTGKVAYTFTFAK